MPHISKRKVDEKILTTIFSNLAKSFSKIKNKDETLLFLNEILTETERIMIGKRLTVIWLLHKGVQTRKIEDGLKISQSTIYRISINYKQDRYSKVIEVIGKKEMDFFKEVYNILHLGGLLKPYGANWKRLTDYKD